MKWTRRKRKSILKKSTKDLLLHWGWNLLRRQLPLPPQDASPTSSWTFRKLQIYPFINWPYPLFSFPLNFSNSPSCCMPFHKLLPALRMKICSYITKLTFALDITTRRTKMPRLQFHRHRHHEHHHLHLEVSERLHFKKVSLQQQIAHLKSQNQPICAKDPKFPNLTLSQESFCDRIEWETVVLQSQYLQKLSLKSRGFSLFLDKKKKYFCHLYLQSRTFGKRIAKALQLEYENFTNVWSCANCSHRQTL